MVYAILYKINPSSKNYTSLYEKIKSLGPWMHYFNDAWLVEPNSLNTSKDIYDQLIPFIDGDKDYILVTKLTTQDHYGWLPKDAWTWIGARSF